MMFLSFELFTFFPRMKLKNELSFLHIRFSYNASWMFNNIDLVVMGRCSNLELFSSVFMVKIKNLSYHLWFCQ